MVSVLVWVVLVLVAGPVPAQVVLVRWVPGVGLAPHQEPVAVQVPGVWGQHQATGPVLGPVVWLPVAQVQAHEPAVALAVLVVTAWALLLVLAAVGGTDSKSVAGYKQSPQQ